MPVHPMQAFRPLLTMPRHGDTILLHPGTYNELVDIDTRLQITSSGGADVTFCTTPINWEDIFDITADSSVEGVGDKFLRV